VKILSYARTSLRGKGKRTWRDGIRPIPPFTRRKARKNATEKVRLLILLLCGAAAKWAKGALWGLTTPCRLNGGGAEKRGFGGKTEKCEPPQGQQEKAEAKSTWGNQRRMRERTTQRRREIN